MSSQESMANDRDEGRTASLDYLTFDDPLLVKDLCGPHDSHLVLMENGLGVRLNPRGNRISISGGDAAREKARMTLMQLYRRLEKGFSLAAGDIDAAMREAGQIPDPIPQDVDDNDGTYILSLQKRTVAPRSPAQRAYLQALANHELVFGVGPAGTGKTYLAVAFAAQQLLRGEVERIILSRPAIEAGERIGFLPGDMKEKVDPYLRPLYDALYDVFHTDYTDRKIASQDIEIAPLAFMRGRTLSRAVIILDEAQNATIPQIKMFLTRLGEGSRMIITGDPSQTDLPGHEKSGLADALSLLEGEKGIALAPFTAADIVRHPLVGRIVAAYERRDGAGQKASSDR